MSQVRRCAQVCPHLLADKSDRCTLPPGHPGQHVAREADGSPKYTWQTASVR
jgi:hypothetical protein